MVSKKRLRLYGEKGHFRGFVADVYVKNNRVVVVSKDNEVKNQLLEKINQFIDKGEYFRLPYSCRVPEWGIIDGVSLHKLGDPDFLKALNTEFWNVVSLGSPGKFAGMNFGGVTIIAHKSKIIDE